MARLAVVIEPETFFFDDDGGGFPNSRLPLLLYRAGLPVGAKEMEEAFASTNWSNSWRNGIFDYHHFHSNAHEVLGIARGDVRICFGGPSGRVVTAGPGDVIVIPAGTGHCNEGNSADLLVIGAYPGGADYDIRRGKREEREEVLRNLLSIPLPEQDPLAGADGPLRRIWASSAGHQRNT